MLYKALKSIIQLALRIYFKKRNIKGLENVPTEGPVLFVSNHPSGYFDPVCIATLVDHKISFLAKATVFENPLAAKIFKSLNMVPVYRVQDNPAETGKNEEMFKTCHNVLENKGAILIFPEGTSEVERRLRRIKTGAARIGLGAAKENEYNLNVKIQPVGLDYTKSSRFRSELSIEFGKPIECKEYFESYKKDEFEAVTQLTDDIEKSIKKLVVNIEKEEHEEFVHRVEQLLKPEFSKEEKSISDLTEVDISQRIYKAIEYYHENDQDKYLSIKNETDEYFENLDTLGLKDKALLNANKITNIWAYTIKNIFLLILGFPIYILGYLHSVVPFKLIDLASNKITDREEFRGALYVSFGIVFFTLFYIVFLGSYWFVFKTITAIVIVAIMLPTVSILSIYYSRMYRKFTFNMKFINTLFSKKEAINNIFTKRKKLVAKFIEIKNEFNAVATS